MTIRLYHCHVQSITILLAYLCLFRKWGKATYDYLRSIVDSEEAFKYQMHYVTAYELHDQPAKVNDCDNQPLM